jgi:hypothetical protein
VALAKGTLFQHTREYVLGRHGAAAWDAIVRALPGDDQTILSGIVLTSGWYPLGTFNRLVDAYAAVHGRPAVGTVSRYIATQDLNIIFKMVLKMASPAFVLKRSPSIYSRYFTGGRFATDEAAAGSWRLELDAPANDEDGPSEAICTFAVPAWLETALELSGARQVKLDHVACRFRGAPRCEYSATF